MMMVWIVWGTQPLAVFSSEAKARAFIASHRAGGSWRCCAARINPEGLGEVIHPAPQARGVALMAASH